MCQTLNLNYDILAKRNHKWLVVGYFYQFFNKCVSITAENRNTKDIFVPTGIVAGYTWNSTINYGTNILRSILGTGRELHFSNNINLDALSKMTQNNTQTILGYLKFTNSSRHYLSFILKVLIEYRRTAHTEYINNTSNHVALKPGAVWTTIQSDISKNKVNKLYYAVRNPCYIICSTSHGSYYVKKL